MAVAADFADWWDRQLNTTDQELSNKFMKEWAAQNPHWFDYAVSVAAVSSVKGTQQALNMASFNFADGFVDVLRLGTGVAEGSFWSIGKDILRLLSIIPSGNAPIFRARKAIGFKNMKVIVDPGGDICTWMSASQALRQTGVKLLATVDDLAKAAGLSARGAKIPGRWADELVGVLRKLGADVRMLGQPRTWVDVVNAAKRHDGVVMFAIKWTMNGNKVGHTIYAFKNAKGQIRFADRTGNVVKNMDELEHLYPGIGGATMFTRESFGNMVLVKGAKMTFLEKVGNAALLALPIDRLRVLSPKPGEEEKIKQSFTEFKQRKRITLDPIVVGKLPPVEYLTGVRTRLMVLGFYDGPISGKFDPVTRQAVIAFQRAHPPLRVDGIPGPRTQARLLKEHGS